MLYPQKIVNVFFLKLILNRVKGSTSFQDLRTINNVIYKTYKEAAIVMGLVETDSKIFDIFNEASSIMFPSQFRKFFAWFLLSENIQGNVIWEKFKHYFTEDFNEKKENSAVCHINSIFLLDNMTCKDFHLPEPDTTLLNFDDNNDEDLLSSKKNVQYYV
jgi:hypothetical protein